MLKNIKRFTLALIALGLSNSILAASSPFCVTVPNQQGGFTVGGDILWLRPHLSDLTFSQITTTLSPTESTTARYVINPSYHWGFDLMAAYRIPCTGNDITALWTHLNQTSDSNSVSTPVVVVIPATATNTTTAKFNYDAVDVDLGQRVNFGDYFNFRIFAGVRGVDLKEQINQRTALNFIPITASINANLDQTSEFRGFGPQTGIEGRYCVAYGFGIDANATLSALVGRTESNATVASFATPGAIVTTTNFSQDRRNRLVPALDASLGVDYTFNFNNCSRTSLVVQAGYKVIHYWGSNEFLLSNLGDQLLAPADALRPNTSSNVSFDGPYLGVKVNV